MLFVMKVNKRYLHIEEMLVGMAVFVSKDSVLDSYGKFHSKSHI